MFSSWSKFFGSCVSRLSAVARSCFLGRGMWRERCRRVGRRVRELRVELAAASAAQRRLEEANEQLHTRVRE